jgi:putative endonuclease
MKENWYLYILRCADSSLYTGITTDVGRRTKEHNAGRSGAKYTKARRPVKVIYTESFTNRSQASKREAEIKKLSRLKKLSLVASQELD